MFKSYTINDIANKVGVSIATVSRTLNNSGPVKESTRIKIFTAIDELEREGWDKKREASTNKVILASFPQLSNPFYANIFKGLTDTASAHGYNVVFFQFDKYASPEAYSFFDKTDFYDGLIVVHAVPDYSILETLSKRIPVVMCSEHSDASSIPFVAIDDTDSTYNAVKFLVSTSRKKIAMLNSSLRNNYAVCRERAFKHCLNYYGLPAKEEWIAHISEINYGLALTAATGILTQKDRPDAFFCVSDVYAAAAIHAAKKLGISVPRDMAVIGFDNIDIATMTVPMITTVAQPTYQLGAQACNLMIEQIEYPSTPQKKIILNTELILREST